MKINGKVAIVTGSSRGIGKAIAFALGKEGAKVVINGRNEQRLVSTKTYLENEGIDTLMCVGDVSRLEDCKKLIGETLDRYGKIDVLVNNAGIASRGLFEFTQPEVFRKVAETNIMGSIYPTMEALPYIKQNKGSILFISSIAGFRGLPNRGPYSMTKMAQTSLAETLHNELFMDGVHTGIIYVNATVNEPEKRVLNADGTWFELSGKYDRWLDTREDVARVVLKAIRNKSFKSIVGYKGKLYYLVQKFFPGMVDYAFQRKRDTIIEMDK